MHTFQKCNMTAEWAPIVEVPFAGDWLSVRHMILIVSSVFGLAAIGLTLLLIMMHATHYSKPWQQKQIIRVITMVPVYCLFVWFSFMFYRKRVYLTTIQVSYQCIALSSFFLLICSLAGQDVHEQKNFFRHRKPGKWIIISLCGARTSSGLAWFNVINVCIFQFVIVQPILVIVAMITEATEVYCILSLSPHFAHVWLAAFTIISTLITLWGLANFWFELRHEFADQKLDLKFLSLKLVVFLTFIQNIIFGIIAGSPHIHATKIMALQDLQIGLPAMLTCIEMFVYSVLNIFAYSWKPYQFRDFSTGHYSGGNLGVRAIMDAYNPVDILKRIGRSGRWLFYGNRGKEYTAVNTGVTDPLKQDGHAFDSYDNVKNTAQVQEQQA